MNYKILFLLATLSLSLNHKAIEAREKLVTSDRLITQNSDLILPSDTSKTIEKIEIRFIDAEKKLISGKTKPEIILQEFALQPGDKYDPELARSGLIGVNKIVGVKQATLQLEPISNSDRAILVVAVEEKPTFFFTFSGTLQPPTALQGSARPVTVEPISNKASGLGTAVRFGFTRLGGNNQTLSLGVAGGARRLGFDLDYRYFTKHDRGYALNLFNRRSIESELDRGENEVDLASGNDPWVHRIGGGIEVFRPIVDDFQGALGITYQLVSIRESMFSDRLSSEDELGNQLTFSEDGQDELLTINLATALDRRNDTSNPTQGYRFLFQSDQAIPVGDASISFHRLSANYTHFIPLPLFGFTAGDKTLVLNFQGGTIIGEVPSYEAFSLGGSKSVRGYSRGELGTGRSFIQATAEYRFPILGFDAFQERWDVGGTIFFDYASDLGSGDTVTGEPGVFRDKPGDGFGYGGGLRTLTPIGLVRLELGISDRGDTAIIFAIGDRF